ncbi:MAG: proline--tRNA ligase [Mycoplasmataceae bacterium]|nr:proline--tRNA ligase [Mycoplasmataceae bacterium]
MDSKNINNAITLRSKNFTQWYDDVIKQAKLVHYAKVKGTIIFTPNSTFIWEQIKKEMDKRFHNYEIKNVMMPTLMQYSSFNLEKKHLEGFAPEMFFITKKSIDGEALTDPLVLRPTSEILFCYYFKDMLVSYNQLPFKYNQWANVFRVEKNTRPFLRTSEFYWTEMHSIHSTKKEAEEFTLTMNDNYVDFINKFLCIPILNGEKTENERFAGANHTFTCEALMQDGQALQCATSHYLAQNFTIPYDITFRNKNNELEHPYQTSCGLSTRIIGAIIMSHSDDLGLVLPWDIAINQIAVCVLNDEQDIVQYASNIKTKLEEYRVYLDFSNNSLGFKIKEQQVLGTPITLLIGKNEVNENKVTLIFRDLNNKQEMNLNEFISNIHELKQKYNNRLYDKAKNRLDNSIEICHTLQEVKNAINNKHIALAPWGGNIQDEINFKKETSISTRCIKSTIDEKEDIKCFYTNNKAQYWIYFAKAY